MKIVSWNVNGLVACKRKGFLKFLKDSNADIVCLQEVKGQCPLSTPGYIQFWNPAKRDNYSGTLTLARELPLSVQTELGNEDCDGEGRLITLEYVGFYVVNVYVPSVSTYSSLERLNYRLAWEQALRDYLATLQKPVILCGDLNVAYQPIDIYPENQKNTTIPPVFASEAREGFHKLLELGYEDAFRKKYPKLEGAYTWWSPKNRNRQYNRGVRLDYFLVSKEIGKGIRAVEHHTDTVASDHCPISLVIAPPAVKRSIEDENLAIMWRTIDWPKMEEELFQLQQRLALAAYTRDWTEVRELQGELFESFAAKVLAVRAVVNAKSEIGVDGVRWKTDAQKMRAAMSLTTRGYQPMPYRYLVIEDGEKKRVIHVPTWRDKAMMKLYAYALEPVAESLADKKTFSGRKGRSILDLHAYLCSALNGPYAPRFVLIVDIRAYYENIIHRQLLERIPMDTSLLRKFLKAGVVWQGEFFTTEKGISLGSPLSPILANMLLDGLQSYIYDRLYPKGKVDYLDGDAFRYADDILITCRSKDRAEQILGIVTEFLSVRGLGVNHEKTHIANAIYGFDFLSRHYCRRMTYVLVEPSAASVAKCERGLEDLILHFNGTRRELIEKINDKLTGWASYHRIEDSYMAFRRMDATVEGLLLKRLHDRHPHWSEPAVLRNYFIKDGDRHVFYLPEDPSVRVTQLAPLPIRRHKPCKLGFNPYLDPEYYEWLQHRRDVQKASGKYRAVWNRQEGKCAYCGLPILADEEVDVVEHTIGRGRGVHNLIYIHRQCAYDVFSDMDDDVGAPLDLCELLSDLLEDRQTKRSPYQRLTEHFRLCEDSPHMLTFHEIESILGHKLDWEAYFYESFWYEEIPGGDSLMWENEDYPFDMFCLTTPDFCISESWLTQGFIIRNLHLSERYIVFQKTAQRVSGLKIPDVLLNQKLPNKAVELAEEFFAYLIREFGL